MRRTDLGFTLVEMPIVLVVIGLVAGGVLIGREMIHNAELVRTQRQYTEILSAIHTFQNKYNCLPGDCANATTFFGNFASCPPSLSAYPHSSSGAALYNKGTTEPLTCNGDGDGKIDAKNTLFEMLTIWQQLGAAGLISGAYTGGVPPAGALISPGINCPPTSVPSRCWVIFDGDNSVLFSSPSGQTPVVIVPTSLGTVMALAQSLGGALGAVFTPTEAASYDGKYDDGSPVSGNILIANGSHHCTDGNESASIAANASAHYTASDPAFKDNNSCNLILRAGF